MGHLWLIGMMGSGKTTIGESVAARRSVPFYDVDVAIATATGMTIVEIFDTMGESAFRDREREAIAKIAAAPAGVVATGGGAVLDPRNVAAMRSSGTTILLDAGVDVLVERTAGATDRPLLGPDAASALRGIDRDRAAIYRASADFVIDAEGTVEMVCEEVESAWQES